MRLTIPANEDDQAGFIQYHLDRAKARDHRGQRIEVEAACDAIRLGSGLVVDPWHCTLDFGGAEVHYLPNDGAAITQLSHRANAFTQLAGGTNNVNLRTPAGSKAVALDLRGGGENTRTSCSLRGLTAQGFAVGLRFSDYAYLTQFHGLVLDGCDTGLLWEPGTDAGENITVFGGVISNGALGLDIRAKAACLNLVGVSIDYNGKAAKVTGSGARVMMTDSHIEFPGPTCLAGQLVVDGNASVFSMRDSEFLVSDRNGDKNLPGPYDFSHLIEVLHPNCSAVFPGTRLHNHRNVSDTWAIGPGRVMADGPTYADALMPRRGHHSQCAMGVLTGYVHQEQAPNTLRVSTVGNVVTGTRGQVGASFVQVLGVAINVTHLRNRRPSLAPRVSSNMDANFRMSVHWSDTPSKGPGTVLAKFNAWVGNLPLVGGVPAPAVLSIPSDLRVPAWANYMLLEFDISGGSAGKWIAVDNVEIGAW